jgi:hypothetical protein
LRKESKTLGEEREEISEESMVIREAVSEPGLG